MKRVLVLLTVMAVIGMAASVSSASTTVSVWCQLVTANVVDGYDFSVGTTPTTASAPGYYGVQIWAQVLGGTGGNGIENLAVSVQSSMTNFVPVEQGFDSGGSGLVMDVFPSLPSGYSKTEPTYAFSGGQYYAYQTAIGGSNWGALHTFADGTGAKLINTEIWQLTSLANTVTVTAIAPYDAGYSPELWWGTSGTGNNGFSMADAVSNGTLTVYTATIPEPNTMMMLGMGLTSMLGIVIRRRTAKK